MLVNRMLYIVYFRGKTVLRRLRRMPVNISYVSKRMNYAVFYGDVEKEKNYYNNLKKAKGFQKIEQSPLYDNEISFSVK